MTRPLLILLFLLPLAACASRPPLGARQPAPDYRSLPTFRGDTAAPASWDELVSACREADIVIIGENHGHPVGLPFAALLWRDILEESPSAALSMEFFERDEQSRLDEYLAGAVDEPTFRERTQRTDSNYPPAHRDMVEAATAAGRPVIAANAPRPLVRLARTAGYDRLRNLSAENQRMFRIPESLPEGRYRDDFFNLMQGMSAGHDPAKPPEASDESTQRIEAMFRSQSLWDWTMAESIARAYDAGHRPIIHIVGRFHSDFDGGLIQALRHLHPDARIITISTVDQTSELLKEEDASRATFVTYVGAGR